MSGAGSQLQNREADAKVAVEIKALQAAGKLDEARDRFAELVTRHQRRASRIAFHYVRDSADADEAVQDAFVKSYTHIGTFREELPFEVWFTRILINGCLDRLKQRKRREKWIAPTTIDASGQERNPAEFVPSRGPSPEEYVLRQERRRRLQEALGQLPERQRLVFMLSQFEGRSSREVSGLTGLNESTVRVHLFRAIRRLRGILGKNPTRIGTRSGRVSRAAH
jgi:RNA polymerase sigma-70 factor (ECF subfamily)